jgi:uncharacterized protein (TIGR03067 family)
MLGTSAGTVVFIKWCVVCCAYTAYKEHDLKQMEASWQLVDQYQNLPFAKIRPPKVAIDIVKITIEDSIVQTTLNNRKQDLLQAITLHPIYRPKRLRTFSYVDGKEVVLHWIYEVTDDTLIMCAENKPGFFPLGFEAVGVTVSHYKKIVK